MNEIIDETRYFIILKEYGKSARTLKTPSKKEAVFQLIRESYAQFPLATIEVIKIEIEKSEIDKYHVFKSGIDLYPTVIDAKEFLKQEVK